jgi:uncharacterized protein
MDYDRLTAKDVKPHSIGKTLVLHLLPGALITLFIFLALPVVMRWGFPAPFALALAILLVLIPFELGVLFYEGRKRNGRFSLEGIVLNREPIPLRQFFFIVPPLFLWVGLCFLILFSGVDAYLIKTVFAWLPAAFLPANWLANLGQYPRSNLVVMAVTYAVANVLTGPVVEELYFRGYLLPRLSRFKGWAPLVNVVLFSLYHFFSPWQQLSRILGLFPMVYAVQKKRNIYIGIITHCLANTVSTASMIVLLFR